jgi:cystathionine beta-lyase/cystathionine gamma-synthase
VGDRVEDPSVSDVSAAVMSQSSAHQPPTLSAMISIATHRHPLLDWAAMPERPSQQTRAITAGRDPADTALAPTLVASTTFAIPSLDEGRAMAHSTRASHFYGRHGNPTVAAFEQAVAELEEAEAARAFSSGMGAMSAVVLGLCSSGDHIVAQHQLYGGTMQLLAGVCPRFGIEVTFVDGTEPGAFAAAVRPGTMLVIAETPANPRLDIVDLDEIGALRGPITVVDSTLATPLSSNPLAHGVSLVLHSATKAMAGHNDATLGVVAGERDLIDALWGFAVLHGANASPHEALNGLRGLRTLPLRLRQQSETALLLGRALEAHRAVAEVRHPLLESHPRYEVARRQMRLGGGLLAFDLHGGLEAGRHVIESLRLCRPATSMGGPETLVTHPASTTHAGLQPEELAAAGITPGTVRVSCGLEDPTDVVADVMAALDTI